MPSTADEAGFNDFVIARTPALTRSAYLLTWDHQLAEDLVQTALFKAARSWDRIEGEPEPYVRRILYTENISWWRSRRHVVETAARSELPSRVDPDVALRLSLDQAIAQLSARQRTVLVLRYYEDLSETQTARSLGIGLDTVKSTNRRALARLRTLAPHLDQLIGADHD